MKQLKVILIIAMLLSTGLSGQNIPTYPIPSYNVPIVNYGNFVPALVLARNPTKAKKEVNVTIHGSMGAYASVEVYSLDGFDVLGPYIVYAGDTLTVEIDEREWGVMIWSSFNIEADVWFSGGDKTPGK